MSAPLRAITETRRILTSQGIRHIDTLVCGHQVVGRQPANRRRCYLCLILAPAPEENPT